MAKKQNKKPKKHILQIDDLPEEYEFLLIGAQTQEPLHKLSYFLNKNFFTNFELQDPIQVIRRNTEVSFQNYATSENEIGQRMRLLNNEVLIPIEHQQSLFDTHEAFYLFPELPAIDYLLMISFDENLSLEDIKRNFTAPFKIKWIHIDLKKCYTAFPVFPG